MESARSEVPALHFIHEQQKVALVAQLAQAQQVFFCGRGDAAFALDSLDEESQPWKGRTAPRATASRSLNGDLPETRRHRFKSLLDFGLARRGDSGKRPPVEKIVHRN